MAQHGWPLPTGRAPRRRVVRTETRIQTAGGRPWRYVYETLECGHEQWHGCEDTHTPAQHRACAACREEVH